MRMHTLVILAAGMGRRLGREAKPIKNIEGYGKPLRKTMELFRPYCDKVLVVVGYEYEKVMDEAESAALALDYKELLIVVNESYNSTNTAASLAIALEEVRGPVLVSNGDLVFFDKNKVRDLLDPYFGDAFRDSSWAATHRKDVPRDEDIKVWTEGTQIKSIGKKSGPYRFRFQCWGEAVGVYRFSEEFALAFRGIVKEGDFASKYYEDIVSKYCRKLEFLCAEVGDLVREFDTPEDVKEIEARLQMEK